jgi:hypothetical protein
VLLLSSWLPQLSSVAARGVLDVGDTVMRCPPAGQRVTDCDGAAPPLLSRLPLLDALVQVMVSFLPLLGGQHCKGLHLVLRCQHLL